MDWKSNILEKDDDVFQLLRDAKRIAVLGIKPESHANQPAFYVPKYMAGVGYEIIPVPVYYPDVTEIMGKPVIRDLRDVEGGIDMVNFVRRPAHIPNHPYEIRAPTPTWVCFHRCNTHDEVAEILARAGIKVVQDRCLMVEHRYV